MVDIVDSFSHDNNRRPSSESLRVEVNCMWLLTYFIMSVTFTVW